MNKITTIHLGGRAYQLEESGYEALSTYLKQAADRLIDNPDKDEIIADFERAIAEKCDAFLTTHKNVVTAQEIQKIITDMGPVDGIDQGASGSHNAKQESTAAAPKRLYRIKKGAVLSGVCLGIAEYFDIDVTLVRAAFVILTILTHGTGIVIYLIMIFIVPSAETNEEMAEARGVPFTAHEFIENAKKNYAELKTDAKGWKKYWHDHAQQSKQYKYHSARSMRQERKEWKRSHPGSPLVNGITGLLTTLLTIGWIYLLVELIKTHMVLGLAIPLGMPLWVAIVLFVIVYNIVLWPLRMARYPRFYSSHYSDNDDYGWFGIWEAAMWLGFVAVVTWVLYRKVPFIHHMLDMLQVWMNMHIFHSN